VQDALVSLTLAIFDAFTLVLVRNFCALFLVIWTALYGLAGLRIAQDHRPCAAGKDNQSPTDGERVDDSDYGLASSLRHCSTVT